VGEATGPLRELLTAAAEALSRRPGLVVLRGGPGAGRSTALRALGEAFRGPVHLGGGLATLRAVPGFALSRAVRARLPVHDRALLAEAVRARVGAGLLLLDDLQWADPATLAALPDIAAHCRVAAALRIPHALALPELPAAIWLDLPRLDDGDATELARRTAPALPAAATAEVVRRAGGLPLAVQALARHAEALRDAGAWRDDEPATGQAVSSAVGAPGTVGDGPDELAHAVAVALADLPRAARTALAALGLLGRPAPVGLLGAGLAALTGTGLVDVVDGEVRPASPYLAEVAAGLLDPAERRALHRRLADLVPPAESAQHLAAAGEPELAYRRAVAAAERAGTAAERAELLGLACRLPGVQAAGTVRRSAAASALAAGRPRTCLRVLHGAADPASLVLRGEAHLQLGDPTTALSTVESVGAVPDPAVRAGLDRVRLLGRLALDPAAALADAARLQARLAATGAPVPPQLGAALAAVRAAARTPGWEQELAAAAQLAGQAGDALSARWSGWLLVEALAADGRLAEAARAAQAAAAACAADLAYSWQTRFLATRLWCLALRGDGLDEVLRQAAELTDRTLPVLARGYATAAAGLAEADGGLLATARARLATVSRPPAGAAAALRWVAREAAWLDGRPETDDDAYDAGQPLIDGLTRITARWAAFDEGVPGTQPGPSTGDPAAVRATLAAWAGDDPDDFDKAAAAWHDLAHREEVRCLLAHGLREADPAQAVPPLLAAEALAEAAGLVVLLGRARRALRRHAVRRDVRGRRAGDELTDREREVLRQVARGEPTRRIAGQLGISRETVETHIRSGMRKLGARTRTEAAVIALEMLG
jgi:DNA-binding CsgD family transcriptional regulator